MKKHSNKQAGPEILSFKKRFLSGDFNENFLWNLTRKSNRFKKRLADELFSYNIVLIGFMGSGKSVISRHLNKLFHMPIIEMDQLISEREGMSIPDIFRIHGEAYFRELETNLLIEMQKKQNVIISCGGGVPLREENVKEMRKNGKVILLNAKPETIYEHVKNNHDRPLLEGKDKMKVITEMMEQRRDKYEAAADYKIETDDLNKMEICESILRQLLKEH